MASNVTRGAARIIAKTRLISHRHEMVQEVVDNRAWRNYYSPQKIMAPNTTLKTFLFARGITQLTVAQKAGIHEPRMSKIIRGHVEATAEEKKAIAKALRQPVDHLFPPSTEAVA
jgi:DNA-binding XRE family transcriptional regulator